MAAHLKTTGVFQGGETVRTTCHMWVRFDQSNHALVNAFNCSSVSDNAQGRTTVNFATNAGGGITCTWPSKNNNWGGSGHDGWIDNYNAGSVKINNYNGASYMDSNNISIHVFGDA